MSAQENTEPSIDRASSPPAAVLPITKADTPARLLVQPHVNPREGLPSSCQPTGPATAQTTSPSRIGELYTNGDRDRYPYPTPAERARLRALKNAEYAARLAAAREQGRRDGEAAARWLIEAFVRKSEEGWVHWGACEGWVREVLRGVRGWVGSWELSWWGRAAATEGREGRVEGEKSLGAAERGEGGDRKDGEF